MHLENIHIGICPNITDLTFSHLSKMPSLKSIVAYSNPQLTNRALFLVSNSETVGLIDLRGCTQIGDLGLASLSKLNSLWEINIQGTRVTRNAALLLNQQKPSVKIHGFD